MTPCRGSRPLRPGRAGRGRQAQDGQSSPASLVSVLGGSERLEQLARRGVPVGAPRSAGGRTARREAGFGEHLGDPGPVERRGGARQRLGDLGGEWPARRSSMMRGRAAFLAVARSGRAEGSRRTPSFRRESRIPPNARSPASSRPGPRRPGPRPLEQGGPKGLVAAVVRSGRPGKNSPPGRLVGVDFAVRTMCLLHQPGLPKSVRDPGPLVLHRCSFKRLASTFVPAGRASLVCTGHQVQRDHPQSRSPLQRQSTTLPL